MVARDGLHQRGLALAVGAQDADALAGHDRAADVAQDDLGGLRCSSRTKRSVIASIGFGRLAGSLNSKVNSASASTGAIFSMRSRAFDAALRLLGLAGLGLEAVDELLQVRDLFLLLGEGGLLLFQLLRAAAARSRCSCCP
jgi:hypothetical protein